ncbi:MAG: hypothetical protein HY473_01610 [Candidatus Sungbacteria bacterium]|uniref:Uncharacterized protein n=1 Tax=Candidatus Sungiibacteriota bacterium TaxID=2750080 RepID=A0A933DRX1_9BACT|nr:hypothetical protein [Candidatus Sungbacteria bacterium]
MKQKYLKRFAEFLVIGIVFNIADNLVSLSVVSDTVITLRVVGIVLLLTLPFAVISELIVDGADIFRHHR